MKPYRIKDRVIFQIQLPGKEPETGEGRITDIYKDEGVIKYDVTSVGDNNTGEIWNCYLIEENLLKLLCNEERNCKSCKYRLRCITENINFSNNINW